MHCGEYFIYVDCDRINSDSAADQRRTAMKDNRNILYINACVREESRTDRLAKVLLDKLGKFEEIVLENADIRPLNRERLNKRTELLEKGDLDDEMFLQGHLIGYGKKETVHSRNFWKRNCIKITLTERIRELRQTRERQE